jgi:hypothetical protein
MEEDRPTKEYTDQRTNVIWEHELKDIKVILTILTQAVVLIGRNEGAITKEDAVALLQDLIKRTK